jgi:hypothetical protein
MDMQLLYNFAEIPAYVVSLKNSNFCVGSCKKLKNFDRKIEHI